MQLADLVREGRRRGWIQPDYAYRWLQKHQFPLTA